MNHSDGESPGRSPVDCFGKVGSIRRPDSPPPSTESSRRPLLRVLFLHSRITAIEQCLRELVDVHFQIESDVVLTSEQCAERLRTKHYDIVLAEYPVPPWQRMPTLDLLRRIDRHIPLIFVTDKMEREAVADLITKGAADCVEMNNLGHLPIAIRRALKENTFHWERNRVEKQLQHSEAHYRALMGNLAFGICRCGMEGQFVDVNQALVTMLGYYIAGRTLGGVNLCGSGILRDSFKTRAIAGRSG